MEKASSIGIPAAVNMKNAHENSLSHFIGDDTRTAYEQPLSSNFNAALVTNNEDLTTSGVEIPEVVDDGNKEADNISNNANEQPSSSGINAAVAMNSTDRITSEEGLQEYVDAENETSFASEPYSESTCTRESVDQSDNQSEVKIEYSP